MRSLNRQRGADSSIGWISFSDTMLFAFGLAMVFANSLSEAFVSKKADYESLVGDHGVLASKHEEVLEELAVTERLLAETQQALDESKSEYTVLQEERESLRKANEELDSKIARARDIYFSQKRKIAELTERVKEAVDGLAKLATTQNELKVVQANYEELVARSEQRERDERRVRGELLGLKGSLDRVAVIFDASLSMKTGDRWDSARQVMLDWVDYLDMKECKLLVFNDHVVQYPEGDRLLKLQGEEGAEDREKMRRFLENVEPAGRTNTLAALREAYQVQGLDTIILFTDGAPYISGEQQRYDAELVKEIYSLCHSHPEVPINAVGLGDYFSPELSAFLLRVSEITQGTFIGR
ncbi:MAG: hypothetical protein RJP95_04880 [Pirellulales bacterium]